MIARYALYETGKLSETFSVPHGTPPGVRKSYNINPTHTAPVVVMVDGVRRIEQQLWGLVPKNAIDTSSVFRYKTYVARSETTFSKQSTNNAIRHNRSIVMMNGFFEFHLNAGVKKAYYLAHKTDSLMAVAGISSTWTNRDGNRQATFSIVTTDAESPSFGETIARPVVLTEDQQTVWLDQSVEDMGTLCTMLGPSDEREFTIHEVSDDIFSKKANSPDLITTI
jgi:putative SOS response-associated peptidase YedK